MARAYAAVTTLNGLAVGVFEMDIAVEAYDDVALALPRSCYVIVGVIVVAVTSGFVWGEALELRTTTSISSRSSCSGAGNRDLRI